MPVSSGGGAGDSPLRYRSANSVGVRYPKELCGLQVLYSSRQFSITTRLLGTSREKTIASAMILIKERSWREGILIWLGAFVSAFLVGGIVAQVIIR